MRRGLQTVLFLAVFAMLTALYWLSNGELSQTVLFALGAILGFGLMWLDQAWLYRYYHQDEFGRYQDQPDANQADRGNQPEPGSQPGEGQAAAGPTHLITRNFLFVLAYVPLAIFVVSSTGSSIGVGLILAIGFILLSELLMCRQSPQEFVTRFLHDQSKFSRREFNGLLAGYAVLFILLSFWALSP